MDDVPPAWFWQFRFTDWGLRRPSVDEPESVAAIAAARRKWREQRDGWLQERGLAAWPMSGLSWAAFRRLQREEPHRVMRRPS